jgi:ATP synthase protein I
MPPPKQPNQFFKYGNMVVQMGLVIGLCAWGGVKLDQYLGKKPIFTIILSLIGIFAGMYLALKDFIHPKNDGSNS